LTQLYKQMKVLVTGAGGFLGRHVVPAICRHGHAVRALGRSPISVSSLGWSHLPVETITLDLCNRTGLDDALKDVDAVVHLALEMRADDVRCVATAEAVTNNLVAAMHHSNVRRMILASSLSVYDWLRVGSHLDEQSPLEASPDDRDGYTRAKLMQETICRTAAVANGWTLTVLRPGIIWGEGIWDFPQLGQRMGPVYSVVGPTRKLPLTHVLNCAEAFALALEQSPSSAETFNVVDEDQCSVWNYLRSMIRRSAVRGFPLPIPYHAGLFICRALQSVGIRSGPNILKPACFAARFGGPRFTNEQIRQRLGWSPRLNFEGVLRAIDDKRDETERTMRLAPSQS
jgi:nucleoside-diphosphate-sugar epimerase